MTSRLPAHPGPHSGLSNLFSLSSLFFLLNLPRSSRARSRRAGPLRLAHQLLPGHPSGHPQPDPQRSPYIL